MQTILIGGIRTACITKKDLVERMVGDCLASRDQDAALPKLVFASNGFVIAKYHRDRPFRELMDQADVVDADGMPLVLVSRLLKNPLPERIATTDFIFDACEAAARRGLRFYFLGGRPENNTRAMSFFQRRFPGLQLVGGRDGYFSASEEAQICAQIRALKIDVLWLGLGSPLQESFAVRHRSDLAGVGWIRTCGGMFDYYSGHAPRAPAWMQNAGLEWLFRASQEPARLGARYLSTNLPALYHLLTNSNGRLEHPPQ